MQKNIKGSLALLLAAFIWGVAFVAQSEGMNYIGPFTFNSVRSLLGFLSLIIVLAFMTFSKGSGAEEKKSILPDKITLKAGLVCGLFLTVATNLQQIGIKYSTVGKAGFITTLYVVIVPIIGIIVGKKLNKILLLTIPMAFVGFFLLCAKEKITISFGEILLLLSAVFYALQIQAVDHFLSKGANGVKISCIQFAIVGIITLIPAIVIEHPEISAILTARRSLVFAGVFSSGVAYTLQILGQRSTDPALASLLLSLESVFAAISGAIILHEIMSKNEIIGSVLVFIAVILTQIFSVIDFSKKGKHEK